MRFTKPLLLLPFLGGALPLAAQTTHDMEAVTITSSLSPQSTAQTPRDVEVISGSRFSQLPVHSLDELLRYVPGVEVQARGPLGAQSDIVIRGGTFQQVLVLVDGLRVNDPITGHFNSNIPIAPNEIDRIEVLKGAASVLYGADAVGGVIHIITKTFSGKQKTEGEARLAGGSYGFFGAQAGGTYQVKNLSIGGGLLLNHTDGQQQRGTKGYVDATTISLSAAYKVNPNLTLSARTAFDDRSFAAQNFYTSFKSDTASEKVRTFWQQAGLRYEKGKWSLRLDGGFKTLRDEYKFSPNISPNDNRASILQGLGAATVVLTPESRLTFGGQAVSGSMESNDRGNHQLGQAGIFALYSRTFKGKFLVEPALRLTLPQQGSVRLIPQLNAAWMERSFKIRGAIGTALREPDFTEQFNNYNKKLVKSGSIGNPKLVAERALSYELGADVRAGKSLEFSATLFRRDQQDLIDFVVTPHADMPRKGNLDPSGTYSLARNIAQVNTSGLELSGRYEKVFSTGNLSAGGGLIWLSSSTSAGSTPGFYISSHARFLANGFIAYQYRWLTLSATGMYKERQAQSASAIDGQISPSYFIGNLRAEAKVLRWLSVFGQVDNISDTKYSDLLGAQMPGRWFSGGVKVWGSR